MRRNPWLVTPAALSVLILTSCADELTQPDTTDQQPAGLATAPAPDTWIPRAPDPAQRVGMVTATVPNAAGQSILYVIGGWLRGDAQGLNLVEAYNVATNTWSRKRDLPMALTNFNGAGVIGGKIYIPGGQKKNGGWSTSTLFVYDPVKDTWTQRAWMPVRGGTGVVGVIGDKLYVSVPYVDGSDRSHFLRYNPATNKWTTLPSPRHAYHMGGVLYGKLYLVADQTEMYDPVANRWTDKAPLPVVDPAYFTIWGTAAPAQAKLYVFTTFHTLVYAPLSDRWTVLGKVAALDNHVAARVFVDGRLRIELVGEFSNYQYVP